MSNQVTVKVNCLNNGVVYDIEASTSIEGIIESIREDIQERYEDPENVELKFSDWEISTPLLSGFESVLEIPADLPEAIGYLEDADNDLEVYEAYEDNMSTCPSSASDIQDLISDADEAYQGEYKDDEDFAREMADQLGSVDKNASWPMNCIDWEFAAKELMYDYFESNGHYFRNI